MRENQYQSDLIKRIKKQIPESVIIVLDPRYIQGVPDLLILFLDKWVALEVKRSKTSPKQPNQEYYVSRLNEMSYASFIYPENESEVINEIKYAFGLIG